MSTSLERLWVPLVVPLLPDGEVDAHSLSNLVGYLTDSGTTGLWVNGTSGEFHALSIHERMRMVGLVAERAGDSASLVAQVGDSSLKTASELAVEALAAGADHIAALPPFYLAYGQDELADYYRELAAVTEAPVVLYDFPLHCKVALEPDLVLRLAREGIASGIKQSSPSMERFAEVTRATDSWNFCCMHGASARAAETLRLGGKGLVCAGANLHPTAYLRTLDHVRAGETDLAETASGEASHIWDTLMSCLSDRDARTAPNVAGMKWALRRMGVIEHDTVRPPMAGLNPDERARLESRVAHLLPAS